MKNLLLTAITVLGLAALAAQAKEYASASDWPCSLETDKGIAFSIFEPMVEDFSESKLKMRSAVGIEKKSEKEEDPIYGAVWFTAQVLTDTSTRKVKCENLKLVQFKCPAAGDDELGCAMALQGVLEKQEMSFDLDYVTKLQKDEERRSDSESDFKNDPPKIVCVTNHTVLVQIDGAPIMRDLDKEGKYEAVANTPYLIAFDKASKDYFLKGGLNWFTTKALMGAWYKTQNVPEEIKKYGEELELSDEEKKEFSKDLAKEAAIMVVTEPTELISIDGVPVYKEVAGTDIMYVENSQNDLFYCATEGKLYILLSGRWYRNVDGDQWEYVAPDSLPEDFYKLTKENCPKEVLQCISGTYEAKEAVEEAFVPQTTKVPRAMKAEEAPEVIYDGDPKFQDIPEAYPVAYAVNTPHDVIKINDRYYLCENAVWYESTSPTGPWVVCVTVPEAIYTIPAAYPVYHVRYVRVYNYTPEYVYVGYYPGYVGCYVNNGVVVYGTGYAYTPWVGTYYYPWPATFGFGVSYSLGFGWGFNISWGFPVGWVNFGFCWSNWCWGWGAHPYWWGGHCGWWGHGCGPRSVHYHYHYHCNGGGNVYRDHSGIGGKPQRGSYVQAQPIQSRVGATAGGTRSGVMGNTSRTGSAMGSRTGAAAGARTGSAMGSGSRTSAGTLGSSLKADRNGNVYSTGSRTGSAFGQGSNAGRTGNAGTGSRTGSAIGQTGNAGRTGNAGTGSRTGSAIGQAGNAGRTGNAGTGSRTGSAIGQTGNAGRTGSNIGGDMGRIGMGSGITAGTVNQGGSLGRTGSAGLGSGSGSAIGSGSAGRVGSSSGTRTISNGTQVRRAGSGTGSGAGSTIRSGSGSGSRGGIRGASNSGFSSPSAGRSAASFGGSSLGGSSAGRSSFGGSGMSGLSSGSRMSSGMGGMGGGGARMSSGGFGGGGARMGGGGMGGGGARMGGGGMGGARMGGGGRGR